MRILVTTGAEFMTGRFAKRFIPDGQYVTSLADFNSFSDTRIKEYTDEICRNPVDEDDRFNQLVEGNVRNADLVTEVDYVHRQTEQAGRRPSPEISRRYGESTVDCTLNAVRNSQTSCPGSSLVNRNPPMMTEQQ